MTIVVVGIWMSAALCSPTGRSFAFRKTPKKFLLARCPAVWTSSSEQRPWETAKAGDMSVFNGALLVIPDVAQFNVPGVNTKGVKGRSARKGEKMKERERERERDQRERERERERPERERETRERENE